MIISERIFALLEKQGMSQKYFAEQTGIAQSTISDWKRKKTNPTADKIMIICDVLNVTPYDLLSGAESDDYPKPDVVMVNRESDTYVLIEKYENMPPWNKRKLIEYADKLPRGY